MTGKLKKLYLCFLLAAAGGCSATGETAQEVQESETTQARMDLSLLSGTWFSTKDGDAIELRADGTAYNLSVNGQTVLGWELEDNNSILFTLSDDLYATVKQAQDASAAQKNSAYYYTNGNELILGRVEYSREAQQTEEGTTANTNTDSIYDTSWKSSGGQSVSFGTDGSVSGTLTIDGDRADSYYVNSDGSVTFTMAMENGTEPYLLVYKTDKEQTALDDDAYYYIGLNKLILDGETYTR